MPRLPNRKPDCTKLLRRYLKICAQSKNIESEKADVYKQIVKKYEEGTLEYDEDEVTVKVTEDRRRIAWKEKMREINGPEKVSEIENEDRESFIRIWVAPVVEGVKQDPVPPQLRRLSTHLRVVKD
jgi:hypothetical protein